MRLPSVAFPDDMHRLRVSGFRSSVQGIGDVPRMFPDDRRPHTKTESFSTTHTKNKSIDPLTENNFRPAHKN